MTLRKTQNTPLAGLTATLSSTTPAVVLLTNVVPFPDLPPFATATHAVPLRSQIASGSCGEDLAFELVLTTAGGASSTNQFSHCLGRQIRFTNSVDSAVLATRLPMFAWATNTLTVAIRRGQVLDSIEVLLCADGDRHDLDYYLRHPPDGAMVQLAHSTLYLDDTMTNYGIGTCGAGAQRMVFNDAAATAIDEHLQPAALPGQLPAG